MILYKLRMIILIGILGFSQTATSQFSNGEVIPSCFSGEQFNDDTVLREKILQNCVKQWGVEETKTTVKWLSENPLAADLKSFLPSLAASNPMLDQDFGDYKLSLADGTLRMIRGQEIKVLVGKESLQAGAILNEYRISPDAKKLIFSQIISGSDVAEWKFYDLVNLKILDEAPIRIRLFQINWSDDSSGVFYSKWPSRDIEEQWIREDSPRKIPVAFRKLGSKSADEIIFTSNEKVPSMIFTVESNGPVLFAFRYFPTLQSMSMFVSQRDKDPLRWKQIKKPSGERLEVSRYIGRIEDHLYFLSNSCGTELCIKKIHMTLKAREYIAVPREQKNVITEAQIINNKIVVQYLDRHFNALLKVFDERGRQQLVFKPQNFGMIGRGRISPAMGALNSSVASFTYSSIETYPVTFRLNLDNYTVENLENTKPAPEFLNNIESQLYSYKSLDGTVVPIQVFRRKDLQEPPKFALLYYYGAINISTLSSYSSRFLGILKMGGIVAIASVRGGGELGEAWSRIGNSNKLNTTIQDIAAASRWLKSEFKIIENRVIAEGGSWGGAHTYMAAVNYPEDFTAFVSLVPVANPSYAFKGLFGWLLPDDVFFKRDHSGEYVDFSRDLEGVRSWSPLHQVPKLKIAKPILSIGAANDERTGSEQNYMMTLAYKHQFGPNAAVYLIETQGGGHKGSSLVEELTFIGIHGGVAALQ